MEEPMAKKNYLVGLIVLAGVLSSAPALAETVGTPEIDGAVGNKCMVEIYSWTRNFFWFQEFTETVAQAQSQSYGYEAYYLAHGYPDMVTKFTCSTQFRYIGWYQGYCSNSLSPTECTDDYSPYF
jgi:hypothetical protein